MNARGTHARASGKASTSNMANNNRTGSGSGRLALAMLVGVAIAGVGGLTAALVHNGKFPPSRD